MDSPLLTVTGLNKAYNAPVLSDFHFDLRPGELHALVGSNGAGKSTFAKILCGLTPPNSGDMVLEGEAYQPRSLKDAREHGVVMVMQELNVVGTLSVAENLFFDSLPNRWGWIAQDTLVEQSKAALDRVGLGNIDPHALAGTLGVGHQQMIEIASALARKCQLLILDEPTAALTDTEAKELFEQIHQLTAAGVGILYVSHRMEEIEALSDRVTVLRDGRSISTYTRDALDMDRLVFDMSGKRQVSSTASRGESSQGPPALELRDFGNHRVTGLNFSVRYGEIVGLAGLVGSGRTETLRTLFGADPLLVGEIRIDGKRVELGSPEAALKTGLALLTEDRKAEGLLLPLGITENAILASHGHFSKRGWVQGDAAEAETRALCERLEVQYHDVDQAIGSLSGGNQQKVLMIRWLMTEARIFLLDEPTRGIDIGAKAVIYEVMRQLAREGKAILVVSSEMPELMELCDRILVLSDGQQSDVYEKDAFDEHAITESAFKHYQ